MKKTVVWFLAILMIFSSAMLTGCTDDSNTDTTITTTTAANSIITTTNSITTTTIQDSATTTTTKNNIPTSTTTPFEYITTATPPATVTTGGNHDQFGINGVRYDDKNNWNKVVDNVFTSDKGGLQMKADGWKTYGTYGMSMVPSDYNYQGISNAIAVALFEPEQPDAFASKTEADFRRFFQEEVDALSSTTISGYPAYKVVMENFQTDYDDYAYYAWVVNTPNYMYVIDFMYYEGQPELLSIGEKMIKTVKIYK